MVALAVPPCWALELPQGATSFWHTPVGGQGPKLPFGSRVLLACTVLTLDAVSPPLALTVMESFEEPLSVSDPDPWAPAVAVAYPGLGWPGSLSAPEETCWRPRACSSWPTSWMVTPEVCAVPCTAWTCSSCMPEDWPGRKRAAWSRARFWMVPPMLIWPGEFWAEPYRKGWHG